MKTDFDRVYPKMTPEEQEEYFMYSICGMHDYQNNTILMGEKAYNRAINYQQQMTDKYLPIILHKEEEKAKKIKPKIKSEQTWKKKWKRD